MKIKNILEKIVGNDKNGKINDIDIKVNIQGKGEIWIKTNSEFFKVSEEKINIEVLKKDDIIEFIEDVLSTRSIKYSQFVELKDVDIGYQQNINSITKYFRANIHFTQGEPGVIMRVIKTEIPTVESLGLPLQFYQKMLNASEGLYLICGSTGSGKSTTIASIIEYYNTHRNKHILTLEDPIEYRFEQKKCLINQREIGTCTNSYSDGLKSSLRQAPDIIFLGELRDFEQIDLALKLSETGHLVISTIHTNNASNAISRILNTTPEGKRDEIRQTLSSCFGGAIHQDLITKKDGGRVLAIEAFYTNPSVGAVIERNELGKLRSIIETGRSEGMITKNQYIEEHIALSNTVDPLVLKDYIRK